MMSRPPQLAVVCARASSASRERGAALLTAMIIVALVATLATSMVWQQWRAVEVETAERARAQSAWILAGALDWARLILREDARAGGPDHLGEPWSVPLAEARLSTFLAADRNNTEDAPDAFLSGQITDAQARYNLRNLIDDQGKVVEIELRTLQRLCEMAGVAPEVATRLATGLRDALARETTASGSVGADAPLVPRTVAQLAWLGVDPEAVSRLRPFVTLLPERKPLNLNTAEREVIAATIEGLDLGSAERLVQSRQRNPLRNLEEARKVLPTGVQLESSRVGISSNYFEVQGRLRLGERVLEQRSLVQRQGLEIVQLRRERVSLQDGLQQALVPAAMPR
jgi:general secretion pathway protein K